MLDIRDRLRIAAVENFATELRHVHQLLRRHPEGFQTLQTERERGRKVLGALPFDRLRSGSSSRDFR